VAGGGDDLERADAVAGREQARRLRLRARVAAAQLRVGRLAGLRRLVLRQQLGVARGDEDLDAGERVGERVEPADVVVVRVRERDAHDRAAELAGLGEDRLRGARLERRVDQRQPVVLLDEERVDDQEAADADHARSSSATHSMCGVWGNMSTGRTRSRVQPASTSCAAFGASVVGLQET
jgi:hypothetical protein